MYFGVHLGWGLERWNIAEAADPFPLTQLLPSLLSRSLLIIFITTVPEQQPCAYARKLFYMYLTLFGRKNHLSPQLL